MTTRSDDWRTDATADLARAILSLESVDDLQAFLRDICTLRELTELASRWQMAQLLDEGLPQREIAERVGASTATVTRVNQWLHHGTGGYRVALDRARA